MSENRKSLPIHLNAQLLHFIVVIMGVAAAYFMTIQSLKIELAAKAESGVVDALDKKLASFEVFLKEGVIGKEQFYRFSSDVEARLIRIEEYLIEKSGEQVGKQ